MKKKQKSWVEVVCAIVSIFLFLCLWHVGVRGDLGRLMPGPLPVIRMFLETLSGGTIGSRTMLVHILYSLARVMAGYFLGAVVGVILGMAMGWSRLVEAIFSPLFRIIRPIPPIAWIPISIIWIGLGEDAKIFLIFLASFCNVTLNAWSGGQHVDLGFERDRLELDLYLNLEELFRAKGKSIRWQDISGALRQARLIKSGEEIEALRQSAQVAREAMEHAKRILCPGKRERDIVAELEYFMRKRGSEGVPFTMKVLSGENAARTINLPGERRIEPQDVVLLDFGAVVGHYASDWTRSFAIGKARPRLMEMYDLVWKIERECIAGIRPGVRLGELMERAQHVLRDHPLKPWFPPYLGHSIGINSQEWPAIVPGEKLALQENMVITIEPGIYVPGVGGVRIEDEVLVTEDGYEILTGLAEEGFVISGEGEGKAW